MIKLLLPLVVLVSGCSIEGAVIKKERCEITAIVWQKPYLERITRKNLFTAPSRYIVMREGRNQLVCLKWAKES